MNTTVTDSWPNVSSGVDTVYMDWDIYTPGVPRRKDYSTTAPDGNYKVRTEMMDYRSIINTGTDINRYVTLLWESDFTVNVTNGVINSVEAGVAAGHLMSLTGYHGRYIEVFDFDGNSNTFKIEVGS